MQGTVHGLAKSAQDRIYKRLAVDGHRHGPADVAGPLHLLGVGGVANPGEPLVYRLDEARPRIILDVGLRTRRAGRSPVVPRHVNRVWRREANVGD